MLRQGSFLTTNRPFYFSMIQQPISIHVVGIKKSPKIGSKIFQSLDSFFFYSSVIYFVCCVAASCIRGRTWRSRSGACRRSPGMWCAWRRPSGGCGRCAGGWHTSGNPTGADDSRGEHSSQ